MQCNQHPPPLKPVLGRITLKNQSFANAYNIHKSMNISTYSTMQHIYNVPAQYKHTNDTSAHHQCVISLYPRATAHYLMQSNAAYPNTNASDIHQCAAP